MVGPLDVAAALAKAAREIRGPQDLDTTLGTIVTVARDSMPFIDHVGISLIHRDGRIETRAQTDPVVIELDEMQYRAGEGPCLQSMEGEYTVIVENARHEQRWPGFIGPALRLGLRSMMGVRLTSGREHVVGALNMYSFSADAVDGETVQLAELFAAHAGLALGHAERLQNLNAALDSRKSIGLALGILMERLGIDEDTAFAYLTRVSATTETKLRDVANSVVAEANARKTSGSRVSGAPDA